MKMVRLIALNFCLATPLIGLCALDFNGHESPVSEPTNANAVLITEFEKCPVELLSISQGIYFYITDSCSSPGDPNTEQSSSAHITGCWSVMEQTGCLCEHAPDSLEITDVVTQPTVTPGYQAQKIDYDEPVLFRHRDPSIVFDPDDTIYVEAMVDSEPTWFRILKFTYCSMDENCRTFAAPVYIAQEMNESVQAPATENVRVTVNTEEKPKVKMTLERRVVGGGWEEVASDFSASIIDH